MRSFYLLFTLLILPPFVFAASDKFGKVSDEEMHSRVCPIDSNAHAYFIFDHGHTYFEYPDTRIHLNIPDNEDRGFVMIHEHHFRIKILDKQGYDWAEVEIPLYYDNGEEKITSLKAATYNLDGKKIGKSKFKRGDMVIEETSRHWKTAKLALPDVREGSIIEVEYTIQSEFYFNLRDWHFQRGIPVLHSEYTAEIPEYFNYSQAQKGYFAIGTRMEKIPKTITFTIVDRGDDWVPDSKTMSERVRYNVSKYSFELKDVPAFPDAPFLRSWENYISKVEFELKSTQFPRRPMKLYSTSWEEVDNTLFQHHLFGQELKNANHLNEAVDKISRDHPDDAKAKVRMALAHMQERMGWNGTRSLLPEKSLSRAYKQANGNSAEINLNLVLLLRELGIKSFPLALSTQDHGVIHPAYPSLTRFNYVIAYAHLEDGFVLLDATDPYSGPNLLPYRCLNDKGRLIGGSGDKWIKLMDYQDYSSSGNYEITLSGDLSMSGSASFKLSGYGAYEIRKALQSKDGTNSYAESLNEQYPDFIISDVETSENPSGQDELQLSYTLKSRDKVSSGGDLVYFPLCPLPWLDKNPLTLEERKYPVEFNYPKKIQQTFVITFPEGYVLAELPQPINASLPDRSAMFVCQPTQMGNSIMVSNTIMINRSLYLPEEYEYLKSLFRMIIEKQSENIVLKKG